MTTRKRQIAETKTVDVNTELFWRDLCDVWVVSYRRRSRYNEMKNNTRYDP